MFCFGQMKFSVDFLAKMKDLVSLTRNNKQNTYIEKIFLDDSVNNNGNQNIESSYQEVLWSTSVQNIWIIDCSKMNNENEWLKSNEWLSLTFGYIVLQGYENRGNRWCSLEQQSDHDQHGHAGHNVRMILYDELMRQYWRRFGACSSFDRHFGNRLPVFQLKTSITIRTRTPDHRDLPGGTTWME